MSQRILLHTVSSCERKHEAMSACSPQGTPISNSTGPMRRPTDSCLLVNGRHRNYKHRRPARSHLEVERPRAPALRQPQVLAGQALEHLAARGSSQVLQGRAGRRASMHKTARRIQHATLPYAYGSVLHPGLPSHGCTRPTSTHCASGAPAHLCEHVRQQQVRPVPPQRRQVLLVRPHGSAAAGGGGGGHLRLPVRPGRTGAGGGQDGGQGVVTKLLVGLFPWVAVRTRVESSRRCRAASTFIQASSLQGLRWQSPAPPPRPATSRY